MAKGGGKTVRDFPCVILVGIGRGAQGAGEEGLGHLRGLFTGAMGIFGGRQKGNGDTGRLGVGEVIRIGTGGSKEGEGPHIGGRTGGGRVGNPGGCGGRITGGGGGKGKTGGAGEEQVLGPMG